MAYSGPIRPLYGGVIRDKCKTANPTVLKAYKTVGEDLLKDYQGEEKADLQSALNELEPRSPSIDREALIRKH
jgi:hypothetical protein